MGRVVDITDRLGMRGRPRLKVGKVTVEVDDSAPTVLRLLELVGDGPDGIGAREMAEVYKLLLSEADRAKVDALGLSFKDFAVLVEQAVELVAGGDAEGEAATPATT